MWNGFCSALPEPSPKSQLQLVMALPPLSVVGGSELHCQGRGAISGSGGHGDEQSGIPLRMNIISAIGDVEISRRVHGHAVRIMEPRVATRPVGAAAVADQAREGVTAPAGVTLRICEI